MKNKPGPKPGKPKTAVTVYLDARYASELRKKAPRGISACIETALLFCSKYKPEIEDWEFVKKLVLVKCSTCAARFSLRKNQNCPQCHCRLVWLDYEAAELSTEEYAKLTAFIPTGENSTEEHKQDSAFPKAAKKRTHARRTCVTK